MTAPLYPPALDLPDETMVRWTSLTKVVRSPEENWPAQILRRGIVVGEVRQRTIALVADPEAAKAILTGGEERFPKWKIYERAVGQGVGRESLSVVQGEQWRRLRRVFAPMFRPEKVAEYFATVTSAAERTVARWLTLGEGARIDASLEMTLITLDVMWRILFRAAVGSEPDTAIARAARQLVDANLADDMGKAAAQLTKLVERAGQQSPGPDGDADNPFAQLGTPTHRQGNVLSETELFDNARTLLGAGHETTALSLTWALWLVGQDREAQRRAQQEIDTVAGDGPLALGHVDRLAFVGQVLRETLRLFPPAAVTVRETSEPLRLAGATLPERTILAVCFYALHRHHQWWNDPEAFRPARFASGSDEPRHSYAFLPFSAGRHVCLAGQFGWTELVTVFATLLRRFRITSDLSVPVRARMAITLRPDREVPVFLNRR